MKYIIEKWIRTSCMGFVFIVTGSSYNKIDTNGVHMNIF